MKRSTLVLSICLSVSVIALLVIGLLFIKGKSKLKDIKNNNENVKKQLESIKKDNETKDKAIIELNKSLAVKENEITEMKKTIKKNKKKISNLNAQNNKKKEERKMLNKSSKEVEQETKVEEVYEILSWFNGLGGPKFDINDNGKITDDRCNTLSKMESFLEQYFSHTLTRKLLDNGQYESRNGKMYFVGGDRGASLDYLHCNYKYSSVSDKKRVISVEACYWDNFEEYPQKERIENKTYIQIKENGKWVFDQIELPF